jgi:hypothetical protein
VRAGAHGQGGTTTCSCSSSSRSNSGDMAGQAQLCCCRDSKGRPAASPAASPAAGWSSTAQQQHLQL